MSVIIAALILRQTITAVAVIGVIVVSLAGALLVWSSGGDAGNGYQSGCFLLCRRDKGVARGGIVYDEILSDTDFGKLTEKRG